MTFLKRKSNIDALILEHYPDSPEAIALNKKGIFLEPNKSVFRGIEELERFHYY